MIVDALLPQTLWWQLAFAVAVHVASPHLFFVKNFHHDARMQHTGYTCLIVTRAFVRACCVLYWYNFWNSTSFSPSFFLVATSPLSSFSSLIRFFFLFSFVVSQRWE